jgi:hypothetical protein
MLLLRRIVVGTIVPINQIDVGILGRLRSVCGLPTRTALVVLVQRRGHLPRRGCARLQNHVGLDASVIWIPPLWCNEHDGVLAILRL